jgi:hypothetical protein
VPWSRASETGFLVTFDAMKSALEPTGFKVVAWDDRTQAAVDWFAEPAEGPRRREGRVAILQAVLDRPSLIIKSVGRA